ncbi:MAG: alpha/beta fold hydrolase [Candidatus Nanopelagicales bacterium]
MERRTLLLSGLTAGAAWALAPAVAAAQPTARSPRASSPKLPLQLVDDDDMNFMALFALGAAGYGSGEVGEVVTAVAKANSVGPQGATYQSYSDAFAAMARQLATYAAARERRGDAATAFAAHLRAAQYWDQVLFFILATRTPGREEDVYLTMDRQWTAAMRLHRPRPERVRIPYGTSYLPGWFLRPSDDGRRRRTVIVQNGSDAQNVDVWAYGVAEALRRGWNALVYDGPGQGSTLFVRQIPFRPKWEKVITPVVDYLVSRPDVDPRRIALTGWSFSGLLVGRAAAFEHRLAGIVLDPGFVNLAVAWPPDILKLGEMPRAQANSIWQRDIIPGMSPQERFTLMKRSEIFGRSFLRDARAGKPPQDVWTLANTIPRYHDADVLKQVSCPALVLSYEDDQFFVGQGRKAYDALRRPKAFVRMTAANGAQLHDAPMAPQYRNEVVFDWLDRAVGGG